MLSAFEPRVATDTPFLRSRRRAAFTETALRPDRDRPVRRQWYDWARMLRASQASSDIFGCLS